MDKPISEAMEPTGASGSSSMIPMGYMAKRICVRPEWLKASVVEEILSLSSCCSDDFADWMDYWMHNGHWLFDGPSIIQSLANEHGFEMSGCRWFYYEGYEFAYDGDAGAWLPYTVEENFVTSVQPPDGAVFRGYDVVTYSCGSTAECSPLSCNHMAE